jgi:hypothetical protein
MQTSKRKRLPLPARAARVFKKLKGLRGMTDDEKALCACGIAATPEERWKMVRNYNRLFASRARGKNPQASSVGSKAFAD